MRSRALVWRLEVRRARVVLGAVGTFLKGPAGVLVRAAELFEKAAGSLLLAAPLLRRLLVEGLLVAYPGAPEDLYHGPSWPSSSAPPLSAGAAIMTTSSFFHALPAAEEAAVAVTRMAPYPTSGNPMRTRSSTGSSGSSVRPPPRAPSKASIPSTIPDSERRSLHPATHGGRAVSGGESRDSRTSSVSSTVTSRSPMLVTAVVTTR